ncbi:MAG: DUF4097 family beta strand repeat protein [Gemmatimonadetes bacterium]|nr:DUF4097 family beta strand repeat protein [Gemmatimonadota bacterium]MBI3568523.1 DUF4097 family beta strand repeat protein [Gemmatimonadota bacterium]
MTSTIRSFLLAGALAAAAHPAALLAQGDRSRIDTTFAFGKGGSVDLGLVSGDIVVTGWTRAEAKISAFVERGYIDATLSSTHIGLQVRSRRGNMGDSRYELMVPIGTRVTAHTVSGEVRVKATAGEVDAQSVSGDVEVIDATDHVTVNTVSGNAHVAKARGRVRVDLTSGDLDAEDLAGDIEAHSVSGGIEVRGARSSHFRAETVSGDITYVGTVEANGTYDITSHSGDVKLEIPNGTGATLSLQSFSGEIESRFPMTLQPGQNTASRRGRKMEFTINGGGARITVETFSGDITIERGASRTNKED